MTQIIHYKTKAEKFLHNINTIYPIETSYAPEDITCKICISRLTCKISAPKIRTIPLDKKRRELLTTDQRLLNARHENKVLKQALITLLRSNKFYRNDGNWYRVVNGKPNLGKIWINTSDMLFDTVTTENGSKAREAYNSYEIQTALTIIQSLEEK